MEQFQYTLVDEQFGRYEAAKERLQFIIQRTPISRAPKQNWQRCLSSSRFRHRRHEPTNAHARHAGCAKPVRHSPATHRDERLGQRTDGARSAAQRRAHFNTSQIDGIYYFALRNYGVQLIQKQGDLYGGIYELTLAERFAPLDNTASGLREGAWAYIQAASYFGVNWSQTVSLFRNVASGWPAMWDGSMNANQRLQLASCAMATSCGRKNQACPASDAYSEAEGPGNLDATAAKNSTRRIRPATRRPKSHRPRAIWSSQPKRPPRPHRQPPSLCLSLPGLSRSPSGYTCWRRSPGSAAWSRSL